MYILCAAYIHTMHCNDNSLENYAPKIRCGYGRRSPKRSLETREKFSHSREFKVHGNGIEPVGAAAVADVQDRRAV